MLVVNLLVVLTQSFLKIDSISQLEEARELSKDLRRKEDNLKDCYKKLYLLKRL